MGLNLPVKVRSTTAQSGTEAQEILRRVSYKLFVSKHQFHLPKPEQLKRELERTLEEEQP